MPDPFRFDWGTPRFDGSYEPPAFTAGAAETVRLGVLTADLAAFLGPLPFTPGFSGDLAARLRAPGLRDAECVLMRLDEPAGPVRRVRYAAYVRQRFPLPGARPARLVVNYRGAYGAAEYAFGGRVSVLARPFEVHPYEGVAAVAGVTTRLRLGALLADRSLTPAQVAAAVAVDVLSDVDSAVAAYAAAELTPSDEDGVYHVDAALRYPDAGELTFRLRCRPSSPVFGQASTADGAVSVAAASSGSPAFAVEFDRETYWAYADRPLAFSGTLTVLPAGTDPGDVCVRNQYLRYHVPGQSFWSQTFLPAFDYTDNEDGTHSFTGSVTLSAEFVERYIDPIGLRLDLIATADGAPVGSGSAAIVLASADGEHQPYAVLSLPPRTVQAGQAFSGAVGSARLVPENTPPGVMRVAVSWGDGSAATTASLEGGAGGVYNIVASHTYAAAGQYAVTARAYVRATAGEEESLLGPQGTVWQVTDGAPASGATAAVTVPAQPGITTGAGWTGTVGDVQVSPTDADVSAWTVTIDWGDGTTTTDTGANLLELYGGEAPDGLYRVASSHAFSPGSFTVGVTVNTGSRTASDSATWVVLD